jgi:erythromycin esterase-like protein
MNMGEHHSKVNIGQLCRETFGDKCALIGFGSHAGIVKAADEWNGEMKTKVNSEIF